MSKVSSNFACIHQEAEKEAEKEAEIEIMVKDMRQMEDVAKHGRTRRDSIVGSCFTVVTMINNQFKSVTDKAGIDIFLDANTDESAQTARRIILMKNI